MNKILLNLYYLVLLTFLSINLGYSQKVQVLNSPEFPQSSSQKIMKYLGEHKGKHYLMVTGKKSNATKWQVYDNNYQLLSENEFKNSGSNNMQLWDIAIAGDKFIGFYLNISKTYDIDVYGAMVDPSTGIPVNEPVELLKLGKGGFFDYGDFYLSFSPDNSMFVLAAARHNET
ncbi:MAG: hypothetical protein ACK4ND_15780, partial [Cytophagaceae bacterium]